MSARMGLLAHLSLKLDAVKAHALIKEHRAEVLREAADMVGNDDGCDCGGCDTCIPRKLADQLRRAADGAAPPTDLTVYRASHDSIVMGLYTTATEARAHCEAVERRAWAKFEDPTFDWIEDEEDGVAELVISGDDADTETGYVVTALTVASKYDEEADE